MPYNVLFVGSTQKLVNQAALSLAFVAQILFSAIKIIRTPTLLSLQHEALNSCEEPRIRRCTVYYIFKFWVRKKVKGIVSRDEYLFAGPKNQFSTFSESADGFRNNWLPFWRRLKIK
jgi:hypothetical protein